MTVIYNNNIPVSPAEEPSSDKLSKYSNLSEVELLQLQVYYLEKQDKEFQKFKELVLKRLNRLEKVITNVRR